MSPERTTRPRRVLIVEDEARLRELLLDVIPDLGFPASAARSAEEARKLMEAEPHDIMLLDLQLPMMDGMDFFEEVRTRWPDTQVIVLTGFGDMESARKAIHLDVVDFLSKPFHLNTIEVALDRARRRGHSRIAATSQPQVAEKDAPAVGEYYDVTLAQSEKRQILAALERNNGNRTAAAAELGISRRTLHYRLNQYRKADDHYECDP
jgi:DNA-binding NtrC family response regulator